MTTLFRNSVIEAKPQPVRSRLEDVVGLSSKSHKELCDHVIHAVGKYRKDKQRLKEQGEYIQNKLIQLQLEGLTNKGKKKVQAPVTAPVPEAEQWLQSPLEDYNHLLSSRPKYNPHPQ